MAQTRDGAVEGVDVARAVDREDLGDDAFARLLDGHLDRTYSLAGYLLGDAAEAEDVTQESMAKAWRSRQSLKDPAAFDGWLDRILVNGCMDRLRRRSIVRFVPIDDGEEVADADPFRGLLARDEVGSSHHRRERPVKAALRRCDGPARCGPAGQAWLPPSSSAACSNSRSISVSSPS